MDHNNYSELCHQVLNLIVKMKGAVKATETQLANAASNQGRILENYKNAQEKIRKIYEMCGEAEEVIQSIMNVEESNDQSNRR